MTETSQPPLVLLTTTEAARMVRMSPRSLEGMRLQGTGPSYVKLGPGKKAKVLYRLKDIETWLAGHTVHPAGGELNK